MSTGPDHYRKAEELAEEAWRHDVPDLSATDPWGAGGPRPVPAHSPGERDAILATAQVHATLAAAAANVGDLRSSAIAPGWSEVLR